METVRIFGLLYIKYISGSQTEVYKIEIINPCIRLSFNALQTLIMLLYFGYRSLKETKNIRSANRTPLFFIHSEAVRVIRISPKIRWGLKKSQAKSLAKRNIKKGISATPRN